MKAMILNGPNMPFERVTVPDPAAGPGEAVARVLACGAGLKPFRLSAIDLLFKEQDILGSRYVTRIEIIESLEIVARGEVWPLVSEIRPLAEAEILHERVERGAVTGRAALLIK